MEEMIGSGFGAFSTVSTIVLNIPLTHLTDGNVNFPVLTKPFLKTPVSLDQNFHKQLPYKVVVQIITPVNINH